MTLINYKKKSRTNKSIFTHSSMINLTMANTYSTWNPHHDYHVQFIVYKMHSTIIMSNTSCV